MESTPTQWPLMLIKANRFSSIYPSKKVCCLLRWLLPVELFNGLPEKNSGWSTTCFSPRTIGDFGKVEVLLRQVAMKPKIDIEGVKIEGNGTKSKLRFNESAIGLTKSFQTYPFKKKQHMLDRLCWIFWGSHQPMVQPFYHQYEFKPLSAQDYLQQQDHRDLQEGRRDYQNEGGGLGPSGWGWASCATNWWLSPFEQS